jgi:hypothetical protein
MSCELYQPAAQWSVNALISVRFGHVPVGSIINLAYNQSDSIVWWLVAPEIWGGRVVACAKEKKIEKF